MENKIYESVRGLVQHGRIQEGSIFKAARLLRGLSQHEVATGIGLSRSTIGRFERGENVRNAKLIRYALRSYLTSTFDLVGSSPKFYVEASTAFIDLCNIKAELNGWLDMFYSLSDSDEENLEHDAQLEAMIDQTEWACRSVGASAQSIGNLTITWPQTIQEAA